MALGLTPRIVQAHAYDIILQTKSNAKPPDKALGLTISGAIQFENWSSPLEKNRAQWANPAAIEGFYIELQA